MCLATSSAVAERPSAFSSSTYTLSSLRAFWRVERGIQSSARNSSRIAPRMRVTAYVSKRVSRSRSYLSMASMSPRIPELMRSSACTEGGSPIARRPATYFTRDT